MPFYRMKHALLASCALLALSACAHEAKKMPEPAPLPLDDLSLLSDSSVEVFPLDGALNVSGKEISTASMEKGPFEADGMPSLYDPSVTVYDFEEDMALNISAQDIGPVPVVPVQVGDYAPPKPVKMLKKASSSGRMNQHSPSARLFFAHDSAKLPDHADRQIKAVSEYAQDGNVQIRVEGHASRQAAQKDPRARAVTNLKTSMDRAFETAKSLIWTGTPPESLLVTARGDTASVPSVENKTEEAARRRVDVYLIEDKGR